ncbi:MAG TPA: hypothetical protein VFJ82_16330 [Longimicrobium sp.]|nr:hypothetical protein [Longimicrobium sp.]
MSSSENGITEQPRKRASNAHRTAHGKSGEHDYDVSFYAGFASSVTVNETELYRQPADETFVLPAGTSRPWSSHAVEIRSSKGYTVVLHIDDPAHVVDRIELYLRDPGTEPKPRGGIAAQQAGDKVVVDNTPTVCPPVC